MANKCVERAESKREAQYKILDYLDMLFDQLDRDGSAHAAATLDRVRLNEKIYNAKSAGDWQAVEEIEAKLAAVNRHELRGGYSAAALDRLIKLLRSQLLEYGRML